MLHLVERLVARHHREVLLVHVVRHLAHLALGELIILSDRLSGHAAEVFLLLEVRLGLPLELRVLVLLLSGGTAYRRVEWFFVLTKIVVERQAHFGGADEVVAVVDAHLLETLGLAVDWVFSVDVDKHFLVLKELLNLSIFDAREDCVLKNLQSLVGADLDLK